MKNSADLGGCYPPRPSAFVDNTLLDLQNSSYPTQPQSIIAKYFAAPFLKYKRFKLKLRVFLAGHSVAMVTYCVTKIIPTCSPVIGRFFDTIIVASIDKECL